MKDQEIVKHISSVTDFVQTLKTSKIPVFVDFYADWCNPCKMAAPVINRLADKYEGRVLVVKVDVAVFPEIAQRYLVSGIPTVITFVNGEKVNSFIGFNSKKGEKNYIQLIEDAISKMRKIEGQLVDPEVNKRKGKEK